MALTFRRLTDDDLPLLHGWLNEPGVVAWWEGDDVSWEAVIGDYGAGSDPRVEHWLACDGDRPVGWIQCYLAAHFADSDEVTAWRALGVDDGVAGIDYLVGAPGERGRGVGAAMIAGFVDEVVFGRHPQWTQVGASPMAGNVASVGALARAGFTRRGTFESEFGPCQLMVRDHPVA